MKTNILIAQLLFAFGVTVSAQPDIRSTALGPKTTPTNAFSISRDNIWDEIGDEKSAFERWLAYGNVMPETLPASQDTNDIWGMETNGLQVSLRVPEKEFIARGEVPAIAILRNVESYPQTLLVTNSLSLFFYFAVYSGTNICIPRREASEKQSWLQELRASQDPSPPSGLTELGLKARSERISEFNLCRFSDLSQPGEYSVQAICRVYSPTTKTPIYEVSSGTVKFQILKKPPSP